jgi:hypothetical protein
LHKKEPEGEVRMAIRRLVRARRSAGLVIQFVGRRYFKW